MSDSIIIALDAMGGDDAPDIVIKGVDLVRVQFPSARFLLYGDEEKLKPYLDAHPGVKAVCEVRHTDQAISGEDKPSIALRKGRKSSMRLAIDAVKNKEAHGVVSAGNTGALMAMAKISLRTLPGIDRPALASMLPSPRGETVMLDLGANTECDADNLFQFAVMGADFARAVLGRVPPRVGLLNVGSEELKGSDTIKEAGERLRSLENAPFEYCGFVEGDDITRGVVDVVVTDGFTGNVALKTAEGTVSLYTNFLQSAFKYSLMSKLGYLLARGGLRILKDRLDPRGYNGAVFLGLNGVCVKSHGGTDALGFANAIAVTIEIISEQMIEKMIAHFKEFGVETNSGPNSEASSADVSTDATEKPASEPEKI